MLQSTLHCAVAKVMFPYAMTPADAARGSEVSIWHVQHLGAGTRFAHEVGSQRLRRVSPKVAKLRFETILQRKGTNSRKKPAKTTTDRESNSDWKAPHKMCTPSYGPASLCLRTDMSQASISSTTRTCEHCVLQRNDKQFRRWPWGLPNRARNLGVGAFWLECLLAGVSALTVCNFARRSLVPLRVTPYKCKAVIFRPTLQFSNTFR